MIDISDLHAEIVGSTSTSTTFQRTVAYHKKTMRHEHCNDLLDWGMVVDPLEFGS